MMNKKMILVVILLASLVFVTGCAQTSTIQNEEQASEAITGVAQDVKDLGTTLEGLSQDIEGV